MLLLPVTVHAHDYWADGMVVPDWVKSSCCGPADAHKLDPDDVEEVQCPVLANNPRNEPCYKIKGINFVITPERVYDSQDGFVWAFYPPMPNMNFAVYCLFLNRGF